MMKKIFAIILFITNGYSGFAQSFQFIEPAGNLALSSYWWQAADSMGHEFVLHCVNYASTSKSVKVRMTVLSTPAGCSNDVFFCDPIACYPASVHLSVAAFDIGAHDTTIGALVPHIDHGFCCGDYAVRYCLFDVNDESDSVNVMVNYHIFGNHCTNGIGELNCAYFLGNAFPNPASGAITIPYEFAKQQTASSIVLVNNTGEKIASYDLENSLGEIIIDPSILPAGIYFYSLLVNGYQVSNKKLVITK